MLNLYLSSVLIYLILFVAYKVVADFTISKEKISERIKQLSNIAGKESKKK